MYTRYFYIRKLKFKKKTGIISTGKSQMALANAIMISYYFDFLHIKDRLVGNILVNKLKK